MTLCLDTLTKSFGEKAVLRGVSLTAHSGQALGLLGRNGAGKTTIIRIVMGVFPPDGGRVTLDGKPLDHSRIRFGYLPEERGLYPKVPIAEQLVYFARLRGLSARDARQSAAFWLKRLELDAFCDKKLDTLSKGNQQKIQLAAALVSNPDVVLLDEPFSGLDPVSAELLKDIVRGLMQEGKIVLFSSHQMSYVEEFCDDIAILNGGEIALSGRVREIRRGYDRRRMLLEGPDLERMETTLGNTRDLVERVERNKGTLSVYLHKSDQKTAFLQCLTREGFDLDGFRVYEPSLHDIFVETTEGGI